MIEINGERQVVGRFERRSDAGRDQRADALDHLTFRHNGEEKQASGKLLVDSEDDSIHLLLTTDGTLWQVPLTYRAAPLPGARPAGEMEHSVLGRRYVYDATTDPVFVQQLLDAVHGGRHEADQFVHVDDAEPRKIDNSAHAWGTGVADAPVPVVSDVRVSADGTDTVIEAGGTTVVVHHRPVGGEPQSLSAPTVIQAPVW